MTSVTAPATEKHPVDEVLPFPQMFTYGLQHVLSMYAGVVAVPLIVGTALKLSRPVAGHTGGQLPRGRTAEGDQ